MKHSYFIFTLLLTIFILTYGQAKTEEIDPFSKTDNPARTYKHTIIVRTANNNPTNAIIQITKINNNQSKNSQMIINKEQVLSLTPGKYNIKITGGLRRIQHDFTLTIPSKKKSTTIILKPYAPIEPAGWIMLDPFYNNTSESKAQQYESSKALELRTLFTTKNCNIKSQDDFIKLHSLQEIILAPVIKFLNKTMGEFIIFNTHDNIIPETETIHEIAAPIYKNLATQHDNNNLIALSPETSYQKKSNSVTRPSEEFIFDTITGPLYDMILINDLEESLQTWYTLLNLHYRIPAIFNSPTSSNLPQCKLYLKLPRRQHSLKMLHNLLKNGMSIISNGPFIRFFVETNNFDDNTTTKNPNDDSWINGHSTKIGGVDFISNTPRRIFAEAYTCSDPTDSIHKIELIYNGRIIKTVTAPEKKKSLQIRWKATLDKAGWLQLRYYSTNDKFFAITNPIYLIDHNNSTPSPAIAKTQIKVLDAQTGQPVTAKITVINFDVTTDSIKISNHPITIKTPATADILVEAAGYQPLQKNIYLDGGSAKYMNSLYKKNLLERAQGDPITYSYLRKALLNSKLTFKLKTK